MALEFATVLAGSMAVLIGLIAIGQWRWNRMTRHLVRRLVKSRVDMEVSRFTIEELQGLPVPVARYFVNVLREGQPMIRSATITHEGQFQTGKSDKSWRPFVSRQVFTVRRPGFVWDARIRMLPYVSISVRDSYAAGTAWMRARIMRVFSVVNAHGKSELNSGALQRYLAELIWLPTALLPSQGIRWSPINDLSARAELTDGDITVSLQFNFNAEGECTGVYAPARYREDHGAYVPTPWQSRCHSYEVYDGIRIPTKAEVEWHLSDHELPYWRGRVTSVKYYYES